MEDVLRNGFELASQSQDCWKYVMRCVSLVLRMEAERASSASLAPSVSSSAAAARKKKEEAKKASEDDDLDLCFGDDDGSGDNQEETDM